MGDSELLRDGNGTVRLARIVAIIGGILVAFTATIAIMWQLFSIAASVNSQAKTNDEIYRRLNSIESNIQIGQMALNNHDLRITQLRSDFDAQRLSEVAFQTEMRASISHIIEIIGGVRGALDKPLPGRK